jgi:hypothetical protein
MKGQMLARSDLKPMLTVMAPEGHPSRIETPGSAARGARVALRALALAACAPLALAACAPSATEGGFKNPSPGAQVYAIESAVREERKQQIPEIVECLRSDDDLVRMMAIGALERMTGQTLGYDFTDPLPLRLQGYRRWKEWVVAQRLNPPARPQSSTIYPPPQPPT